MVFVGVIGDGAKVDIYKYRWSRNKDNFMVERGYDHEAANVKVNTLFYPGTRNWDVPFIKGIFNEDDADAILSTPVSSRTLIDRVVWHEAKNGVYNTRDGYRFWSNQNALEESVPVSKGWSKIWRMLIPHKARVFLWRLGRNNLPVKEALSHKGVNLTTNCSFYVTHSESAEHLFFNCHFAKKCWQEGGMNMALQDNQNVSSWLLHMLTNET